MTSKLGRNPFQKSATAQAAAAKAPETEQPAHESSAQAPKSTTPSSAKEKPQAAEKAPKVSHQTSQTTPRDLPSFVAQVALVDLPAHAIVLGLKVFLLARETFSKDRS